MRRTGPGVAALLGWLVLSVGAPLGATACTPYEMPDLLAHGIAWAAAAVVTDQVENHAYPDLPPLAVVLTIQETIVGDATVRQLRIEPTDGCHPFWYRPGDLVIAAIGREVRSRPPFEPIDNFSVVVWVVRDGRVDASRGVPPIDGRIPETEQQLRMLLMALPDTATIEASPPSTDHTPALVALALAAALGAGVGWRRFRSVDRS